MDIDQLIADGTIQASKGDKMQLAGTPGQHDLVKLVGGHKLLRFVAERCYTLVAPDLGLAQALVNRLSAGSAPCVVQVTCGSWGPLALQVDP